MAIIAVDNEHLQRFCSNRENDKIAQQLFDDMLALAKQIAIKTNRLHEVKRLQCESYNSCDSKSAMETLKRGWELWHEVKSWVDDAVKAAATVQGAKWLGQKIGSEALGVIAKGAGLTVAAGSAYFSNMSLTDEDAYYADRKHSEAARLAGEQSWLRSDITTLQKQLDELGRRFFLICGPFSGHTPPPNGPTIRAR